jgi:hypothetical protein
LVVSSQFVMFSQNYNPLSICGYLTPLSHFAISHLPLILLSSIIYRTPPGLLVSVRNNMQKAALLAQHACIMWPAAARATAGNHTRLFRISWAGLPLNH